MKEGAIVTIRKDIGPVEISLDGVNWNRETGFQVRFDPNRECGAYFRVSNPLFRVAVGVEVQVPFIEEEKVTGIEYDPEFDSISARLWSCVPSRSGLRLNVPVKGSILGGWVPVNGPNGESILTASDLLPLPEGDYGVEIEGRMFISRREKFPSLCKTSYAYTIKSTTPIPIPGKGENDYDIDDDASYQITFYRSERMDVEEAIDEYMVDILSTRLRHGHSPFWMTEKDRRRLRRVLKKDLKTTLFDQRLPEILDGIESYVRLHPDDKTAQKIQSMFDGACLSFTQLVSLLDRSNKPRDEAAEDSCVEDEQ